MRTDAISNLKYLPSFSASKSGSSSGTSFSAVFLNVRAAGGAQKSAPAVDVLQQFVDNWSRTEERSLQQLKGIDPQYRGLVELQLNVNQLHLQTELMTKGAEAVGSTLRRLQQVGN